jgi:hypothetical protein
MKTAMWENGSSFLTAAAEPIEFCNKKHMRQPFSKFDYVTNYCCGIEKHYRSYVNEVRVYSIACLWI